MRLAERKLLFVVSVIQASQRLHSEAVRLAAAAHHPPVAPYVSHYNLVPSSASTRWSVKGQQRLEQAPANANTAALLPQQAEGMPAPSEQPSSDRIYSRGLGSRELTEAGVKDAAFKVSSRHTRRTPRVKLSAGASPPTHPPPTSRSSSLTPWPWALAQPPPWPPAAPRPCTTPSSLGLPWLPPPAALALLLWAGAPALLQTALTWQLGGGWRA